jgi:hypothetical protein
MQNYYDIHMGICIGWVMFEQTAHACVCWRQCAWLSAFEMGYVALWPVQQLDVIWCREQQYYVLIRTASCHALPATLCFIATPMRPLF